MSNITLHLPIDDSLELKPYHEALFEVIYSAESGNLRLSQPHKMVLLELMHAVYQAETQESDLILE